MNWLQDSLVAHGAGTLLLVAVCAAVYLYRRQTYFLYWTLSWLAFGLWPLLLALFSSEWEPPEPASRRLVLDLAFVCGWWHLALWVLGTWSFWRGRVPQARAVVLALAAAAACGVAVSRLSVLMPTPNLEGFAPAALNSGAQALVYSLSALLFALAYRRASRASPAGGSSRAGAFLLAVALGLDAALQVQQTLYRLIVFAGAPMPNLAPVVAAHLLLQLTIIAGMILVVLGRDQDQLRDALGRLAESEERFRVLFEHCGVAMALLGRDGELLEVNPALVRLLGHSPDALSGKRLADLAHPDEQTGSVTEPRSRLSGAGTVYERERRYLHKSGQAVWTNVVRVPVREVGGAVRYLVAVLIDITARKRAEQRLREERDFSDLVLDTADALVVVLDPQGRIVRCNRRWFDVTGYAQEEVVGKPSWELTLPPADVEAAKRRFFDLLGGAGPERGETVLRTRSGASRLVVWHASCTLAPDGSPRHVVCIGLDVTGQRKLEEQLRQAQKMETLGTLVGGIAHDFNNQLTAILGNLEIVRRARRGEPGEDVEGPLHDAEEAARRCAEMTRSLLAFGRPQPPRQRCVDVNRVVLDGCRLLRRLLPSSLRIDVRPAADVWPVTADRTQLDQVMMNLAINARDAMGHEGVLTVATANRELSEGAARDNVEARPGKFVELCVSDTGSGMTAEVRARIFEPFFTTKEVGKGTGLGLPMVYGIVKAHGGWIEVDSAPGKGTTFRAYLPAADADPDEPPPAPPRPAEHPGGGAGRTVLVVDDEEPVRRLGETLFRTWGFRVVGARDGREALRIIHERPGEIDLVLLDLMMPGMHGQEVLRELRRLAPQARVICSSGFAGTDVQEQLLAAGAAAFVQKPYHLDDLGRVVREALSTP